MSRTMTAPNQWRDEGPQTPYSPTLRWSGSMALPLGKPASLRIPTPGELERIARAHAAYNERKRRLRYLTERQRQVLDAVERHAGNRSAASRELGVTTRAVQDVMRRILAAGKVDVPPIARRGPDLTPRKRAA